MAEEEQGAGEKTEEPSAHRIEQFRKRGDVASSRELSSVLVLSACILVLGISMAYIYEIMSEFVEWLYTLDPSVAYTPESLKTIVTKTASTMIKAIAPVLFTALCIGVLGNLMQVGFLYAAEALTLKPERINPIEGFKRLFSVKSLVEAIKGIFKFILVIAILYFFLRNDIYSYSGFLHMDYSSGVFLGKDMIIKLAFYIILAMSIVALGDFIYQKVHYQNRLRMTKQEAKRELKEQEGSPEVRQRIRAVQRDMANRRMMDDVKTADVIVTNPTHLSVALKYDKNTMISPEVVGKGADHLAMRIREIAKKSNIPLVENVPLARALYGSVKVGEGVPRTLYKAVAEVLAFVYKLKKKEKALQ